MRTALNVNTWAKVASDCDIANTVHGHDDVAFQFGDHLDGIECVFAEASLRRLVELASAALEELSATV
ncbi:hypothetical protein [Actinokineospora inagensis]|uniref:hypothetical protein n=1 Tax=Actinokineospora inagensis TaxID=103730 RepID=UPI000411EF0F|nr:hypothetical protein [Actinokineospora inagensis]